MSWQHAYFLYCQNSRFKDVLAKPSHNAIVMEFSRFLLITMFSSEMFTLVKILDTISLIFRFLSISFLIRSLQLIAFSPLGYQLLCWVTYIRNFTLHQGFSCKTGFLPEKRETLFFTMKNVFFHISTIWLAIAVYPSMRLL